MSPLITRRMQLAHYAPARLVVLDSPPGPAKASSSINEATRPFYNHVKLPRRCFDDTSAMELLEELAPADVGRIRSDDGKRHYLALSASAALLGYLESERGMRLQNLRVRFVGPGTHVMIDGATLETLEILHTCRYAHQRNAHLKGCSVFSAINYTRTLGGQKLLKASLVQPLKDLDTIRARQECVKELLANEDMRVELTCILEGFPRDHERVCLQFAATPPKTAEKAKWISQTIAKLVRLRALLADLPRLRKTLEGSQALILQAILAATSSDAFGKILGVLGTVLEEGDYTQDEIRRNVTHQIFLVRAEPNGELHASRQEFCRISEQIHHLADGYRAAPGLGTLRLSYGTKQNFYLTVGRAREGEPEARLPENFIPIGESAKSARHYTTLELNILNGRLQTALDACFDVLTGIVDGLLERVHAGLEHLRVLSEAISLLDLVASFADYAKQSGDLCTCPVVSESGPLLIVEGRHPVLLQTREDFTPNSTFLSLSRSMEVVSGPNMSGKSTYSRQVALIAVMAFAGSFVPARFAHVPMLSAILTRCTVMRDSGCLEDNASSFLMEMRDIARVTESLRPHCLVLVDEIGRSTSEADGEAIAWSAAEHLLSKRVLCVFVSHFALVSEAFPAIYPRCLRRAFGCKDAPEHALREVVAEAPASAADAGEGYGIDLARSLGFPDDVLAGAKALARIAAEEGAAEGKLWSAAADGDARADLMAFDRLQMLAVLWRAGRLSAEDAREEFRAIQNDLKAAALSTAL